MLQDSPVTKKSAVLSLNDLRPVAATLILT